MQRLQIQLGIIFPLDHLILLIDLARLFILDLDISRVKHDPACPVDTEVIHQQARRTTFVKVGRCLFKQRVNGEFEVEFLHRQGGE